MEQNTQSPLTRLIIVIIFLAVAGSIVGGLHYVNVDLPSRTVVQVSEDRYVCSQCTAAWTGARRSVRRSPVIRAARHSTIPVPGPAHRD